MRDVRELSGRQLAVVWLAGLALTAGALHTAWFLQRQTVRSMIQPMARRALVEASRMRELDSLYTAYAREHPEDRAAQTQAAQRRAERLRAERRDSVNRALIRRASLDTAYDGRAMSQRNLLIRVSSLRLALFLASLGMLAPVALVALTGVWWAHRRRQDRRPSEGG